MLDGFNSYFEILLTLNLAYAGSKVIKDIIDAFFNEPLFKKLDLLEKTLPNIVDEKIKLKKQKLIIEYNDFRETPLTVASKAMFLFASLYCLIILLLSGFEQELQLNEIRVQKFCSILHLTIFYQIYLYTHARKETSPQIKNLIAFSLWIFLAFGLFGVFYAFIIDWSISLPKIYLFFPLIIIPLFALAGHILHASKKYKHFANEIDKLETAKNVFAEDD
jgi:hypothetical protein